MMEGSFALSRSLMELLLFFGLALSGVYASQWLKSDDNHTRAAAQEERVAEICEKAGGDLMRIGGDSQFFCKMS